MVQYETHGTFEVNLNPATDEGNPVGRLLIAKSFRGELSATSVGQMLAVRTATEGSAGYVAMEVVTGNLQGRSGSFALQHSGTMDRGVPSLDLHVVPDSGTGELTGLAGTMTIDVVEGEHRYGFRFTLPDKAETPV